ncbi:MAG TPA: hypothetical protein VK819_11145 [Acidobacteriaceae bacterium]|jgi:hypothetical protein|nr:hypothetical protein [Acidobacteriaceae bacterium]
MADLLEPFATLLEILCCLIGEEYDHRARHGNRAKAVPGRPRPSNFGLF